VQAEEREDPVEAALLLLEQFHVQRVLDDPVYQMKHLKTLCE